MSGGILTILANQNKDGKAYGADFVDTDNLSSALSWADCITALAIQFKEWRDLPATVWMSLRGGCIPIPLRAVRTRWGPVHVADFQEYGKCLRHDKSYLAPSFQPSFRGSAVLVATPARCFATRLYFELEFLQQWPLTHPGPGFYDLPKFVELRARANSMSIIDLATGVKSPHAPVADSLAWEKGMRFTYSAHGIEILSARDGLAEEVLRIFGGGRAIYHQGAYDTSRIKEHDLRVAHSIRGSSVWISARGWSSHSHRCP